MSVDKLAYINNTSSSSVANLVIISLVVSTWISHSSDSLTRGSMERGTSAATSFPACEKRLLEDLRIHLVCSSFIIVAWTRCVLQVLQLECVADCMSRFRGSCSLSLSVVKVHNRSEYV